MTSKLWELHPSTPVNPVIAHPLFLAGYIEHLGTGTTDMIDACREYGLRDPEFVQEEDFRVVIWRKKVSESNEKVTENILPHNQFDRYYILLLTHSIDECQWLT